MTEESLQLVAFGFLGAMIYQLTKEVIRALHRAWVRRKQSKGRVWCELTSRYHDTFEGW